MLPVPERGRGPGQSALQDAGLPEARGHPGAAQPVGEEDRAAQIRVGPRQATKGTHRRERGVHRHLAQGHLGKVAGWGSRNHRGGAPSPCTRHPGWSVLRSELVDGTESHRWQGHSLVPCPLSGLHPHHGLGGNPNRAGSQLWVHLWLPILICKTHPLVGGLKRQENVGGGGEPSSPICLPGGKDGLTRVDSWRGGRLGPGKC